MKVLVCGSRYWNDKESIRKEILRLKPDVVIEGEANGADSLARQVAEELGIEVKPHRAKWEIYDRAAGPIRNQEMLDEEKPDLVLAFHHDLENSKGTKDMVQRARKAGVPVQIIT
jgi:hypothetical protein